MPGWEWVIIILGLVLIVFFLLLGRRIVDYRYSFGQWTTTESGCLQGSDGGGCLQGGTQYSSQVCIPDAKTRRGCISANGLQTYAPQISQTSCALQCQQFRWDIQVGACDALTGLQHVTYTCVNKDVQGINGCTTAGLVDFNGGKYQDVAVYGVGDVVEWDQRCLTSTGSGSGKVATDSNFSTPYPVLPAPSSIPTHYTLEEDCNSSQLFQEGWRLSDGAPCRKWLPGEISMCLLQLEDIDTSLVPQTLPSTHSSPELDFRDWSAPRQEKLRDVPLIPLPKTKFRPGYGVDDHRRANGAILVFPKAGGKAKVGCLLGTGYWGWLTLGKGRTIQWSQAAFRPGDPGLSWADAPYFYVHATLEGRLEVNSYPQKLPIFVGSLGGIRLKGWVEFLHPGIDLSFRIDNPANVYRHFVHRGRAR